MKTSENCLATRKLLFKISRYRDCKDANIWFDHVSQMDVSRLQALDLSMKVSGRRSKGRPIKRWIDCIREDVTQRGGDRQILAVYGADMNRSNREFVQLRLRRAPGASRTERQGRQGKFLWPPAS